MGGENLQPFWLFAAHSPTWYLAAMGFAQFKVTLVWIPARIGTKARSDPFLIMGDTAARHKINYSHI